MSGEDKSGEVHGCDVFTKTTVFHARYRRIAIGTKGVLK